jgi:hypothetical protein
MERVFLTQMAIEKEFVNKKNNPAKTAVIDDDIIIVAIIRVAFICVLLVLQSRIAGEQIFINDGNCFFENGTAQDSCARTYLLNDIISSIASYPT